MTFITCPSEQLPGPVPVRLEVPDGWLVEPAPNISFAAASPDEVEGMHANIVVSVRRIDGGLSLEQVTDVVGTQLSEVPGASEMGLETVDLDGRDASARRFCIEDAETGARIDQCQLICVVGRSELIADAVTATLTFSSASPPELVQELMATLRTLRVG